MKQTKTVCMDELLRRLTCAGLSPETAYRMMVIQDVYLYQLGVQDEINFPEEEVDIVAKARIYDCKELENYFIYKLRVTDKEAAIFTSIEFSYLEELGIA